MPRILAGAVISYVPARETPKRPLDELHLADLISLAVKNRVIDEASERQAGLAKDARNMIHPGKALQQNDGTDRAHRGLPRYR